MTPAVPFELAVSQKIEQIVCLAEDLQGKGIGGTVFNWFIPDNTMAQFPGFKTAVFDVVKEKYFITDLEPGFSDTIGGIVKKMYVVWDERYKHGLIAEGHVFLN